MRSHTPYFQCHVISNPLQKQTHTETGVNLKPKLEKNWILSRGRPDDLKGSLSRPKPFLGASLILKWKLVIWVVSGRHLYSSTLVLLLVLIHASGWHTFPLQKRYSYDSSPTVESSKTLTQHKINWCSPNCHSLYGYKSLRLKSNTSIYAIFIFYQVEMGPQKSLLKTQHLQELPILQHCLYYKSVTFAQKPSCLLEDRFADRSLTLGTAHRKTDTRK